MMILGNLEVKTSPQDPVGILRFVDIFINAIVPVESFLKLYRIKPKHIAKNPHWAPILKSCKIPFLMH